MLCKASPPAVNQMSSSPPYVDQLGAGVPGGSHGERRAQASQQQPAGQHSGPCGLALLATCVVRAASSSGAEAIRGSGSGDGAGASVVGAALVTAGNGAGADCARTVVAAVSDSATVRPSAKLRRSDDRSFMKSRAAGGQAVGRARSSGAWQRVVDQSLKAGDRSGNSIHVRRLGRFAPGRGRASARTIGIECRGRQIEYNPNAWQKVRSFRCFAKRNGRVTLASEKELLGQDGPAGWSRLTASNRGASSELLLSLERSLVVSGSPGESFVLGGASRARRAGGCPASR